MKTITEGLQEIKTLTKRIVKKRDFIKGYLWRQNHIKDPHEKDGGSNALIAKERQAIQDLEDNIIAIRCKIAIANSGNSITVCGDTRTISEWIIWRREIAQPRKNFLESMHTSVKSARAQAIQNGLQVVDSESKAAGADIIVNVDEKMLYDSIEKMTEILSELDGQLSLKNATLSI